MPTKNIIQAVNEALHLEMTRQENIVILGEDIGKFGGVFRATSGLHEQFGAESSGFGHHMLTEEESTTSLAARFRLNKNSYLLVELGDR